MSTTWLATASAQVTSDPTAISQLFPAVGSAVGRAPVRPIDDPLGLVWGTHDDHARAALVVTLLSAHSPHTAFETLRDLYRFGDDAEKRGVLAGVNAAFEQRLIVGDSPLEYVRDALRTNDPRLVAAALGSYGAHALPQHEWRHGVLKAIFMLIPAAAIVRLEERRDAELSRMARALIAEREAASRTISADLTALATVEPEEDPDAHL